jgi:hypothetical protein
MIPTVVVNQILAQSYGRPDFRVRNHGVMDAPEALLLLLLLLLFGAIRYALLRRRV